MKREAPPQQRIQRWLTEPFQRFHTNSLEGVGRRTFIRHTARAAGHHFLSDDLNVPNTEATPALIAVLVLATMVVLWPQPLSAQCSYTPVAPQACTNIKLDTNCRPNFLDLANTSLGQTMDMMTPAATLMQRFQAATLLDVCEPLNIDQGFGPDYARRILARFAYRDLFGMSDSTGATALENEAITSLTNLQRSDFGAMGTDSASSGLLGFLEKIVVSNVRKGDGDMSMQGLTTILLRYGSRLPQTVYDHVLNDLIDLSPRLGSVETLSFGASDLATAAACAAVAASCGPFGLFCGAGCVVAVQAEQVQVPETENHITMIYVLQYLKNQILFDRTNDPKFDNAQNGYRSALLNRLKGFVRNDFVEYNAHPYQDFEMYPLLNLFSFAEDPAVKAAAKMVLDYISAKVVVSSDSGLRSTPFRRHNDTPGGYFCDELLLRQCTDPQTAWYMMLAGVTDILKNNSQQTWYQPTPTVMQTLSPSPQGAPNPKDDALSNHGFLSNNWLPETYAFGFQLAGSASYAIDPLVEDLFTNSPHQTYYQFLHYANPQRLSGSSNTNDELYFRSPSYLISAGGHPNDFAYAIDFPFPINLIVDALGVVGVNLISTSDDLGVAVPTTLMPTGTLHSRSQMIRFYDPSGENLCVWRNFACGLNPVIPANYQASDPGMTSNPPPGSGTWLFFDESGGSFGPQPGYFVAVYKQDSFGFLEVYDTLSNPPAVKNFNDFANKVFGNNSGQMFSQTGVNTYKVIAQNVIQFTADAHIVSVDGKPPYDPNRTNGDIINNNGTGMVTIMNPFTGASMTLDASVPAGHPSITVPGPLNFPDTCVGATSKATFNVCNTTTGSEGLSVYNILSQNTQFQVTEPSSGFPTSISPDFCLPFQAQFSPVGVGTIQSKLTVSNSDPTVPELKVAVSGNGIQQSIATVISNSGNFGNVCVGSFADLNLTINNTGGCTLMISNITSSSADFTVAGALSFPLTVGPGDSLPVPIRFHPSSFGSKTGNITIANNDPKMANAMVAVSGNAPPPGIKITGDATFGNVCAGSNAEKTIQVCDFPSVGSCSLSVISAALNAGCTDFTLVNNPFPATVSSNSCLNLTVRFTPASAGAKSCTLTINSNDPTAPGVIVPVTANTPTASINIPPDLGFPPTVIQTVGSCKTPEPLPISNTGACNLNINSVALSGTNGTDYGFSGLPSLPTPLQPGHVLGDGNMNTVFGPLALGRDRDGLLTVTYESDPITHATTSVTRNVCGEGVKTGARLLVTAAGVPLPSVKKIHLARLTAGQTVDEVSDAPLQTFTPAIAACSPFMFHREWGTVSNPIQLVTGSYRLTVTVVINGKVLSQEVSFNVDTCGFNPNIVVNF